MTSNSASYQPFVVTVDIDSEVLLSDTSWLTLDSVMAALLVQSGMDPETAARELPLGKKDGVWQASAAFFDRTGPHTLAVFKNGLSVGDLVSGDFVITGKRGNDLTMGSVLTNKGPYQTRISTYDGMSPNQVVWYGFGDINDTKSILQDLRYIGKKHHQGYGRLKGPPKVLEVEEDVSCVITSDISTTIDLFPMRQIPAWIWQKWGHGLHGQLTAFTIPTLPYFNGTPEFCVVPPNRKTFWAS
jgi:CRISPR type IV-associated protein Csf3